MASTTRGSQDGWVADSGATEHMSKERHWFTDFQPIAHGVYPVRSANKVQEPMFCRGKGNITVRSQVGKKWITLVLTDVLYVPDLGRNLFSIREATKKGAKVIISGSVCEVWKGNSLKAVAEEKGKLYHLKFQTVTFLRSKSHGRRS